MERIVLDTNCLVMAVSAKSVYNKIWQDFMEEKFVLCISNEILKTIDFPKLEVIDIDGFLRHLG